MKSQLANDIFHLLERLHFNPRIKSQQFLGGRHDSLRTGTTPDFVEYRDYLLGEPHKNVDWRSSLRHDRLMVREREHQGMIKHYMLLDGSGSMDFPNPDGSKYRTQTLLAGALIYLLSGQGDPVGLLLGSQQNRVSTTPRLTWEGLSSMVYLMSDFKPQGGSFILDGLNSLQEQIKKPSCLWLMTDFDMAIEPIMEQLAHLRDGGHDIRIIHLYHPWERQIPWRGDCLFQDLEESYEECRLHPEEIDAQYQQEYDQHVDHIQSCCRERSLVCHYLNITKDIEAHLVEILQG